MPQWIGTAIRGREQRRRPRGPRGVEVAGAECRCPSPRPAAARGRVVPASSSISVEQVGVAGEVDAALPSNLEADRLGLSPGQRPRWADGGPGPPRPRRRRPPSVSPGGQLATRSKPPGAATRPAPRGTISGTSRPTGAARAGRGGRGAGGRSARRRVRSATSRAGAAPWRRRCSDPVAQHRIGEQPDAVELDQDGRVADERQTIPRHARRQGITPYG